MGIEAAPARLLLIEDDESFRAGVLATRRLAGFEVQAHGRAGAGLHALKAGPVDAVLSDLRLPDMDGLEVLGHCRGVDPDLPVVLMTGHGDVETAVRAIRDGAYDFIEKPFDRDRLVTTLQRAVAQCRLARENRGLRTQLAGGSGLAEVLCGRSAAMQSLRELILRLAPTPVDVLVVGATGTGKELVARALHDFSGRRGAFVAINCAALPETLIESELFGHESGAFTGAGRERVGRIEHAQHGTLVLDEIEAMPPALQAKLLRVLQEREIIRLGSNKPVAVDVRVVAASNSPLAPLIQQGRFRADLSFRLDVVKLELPPLTDRREDIVALFELFAGRAALRFGVACPPLATGLPERLLAHDWPGNVRELKSAAERHVLGLPVLPVAGAAGEPGRSLQATLEMLEAMLIEAALARHKGRVDAACRELDVSPATLYRKLKAYGLQAKAARDD